MFTSVWQLATCDVVVCHVIVLLRIWVSSGLWTDVWNDNSPFSWGLSVKLFPNFPKMSNYSFNAAALYIVNPSFYSYTCFSVTWSIHNAFKTFGAVSFFWRTKYDFAAFFCWSGTLMPQREKDGLWDRQSGLLNRQSDRLTQTLLVSVLWRCIFSLRMLEAREMDFSESIVRGDLF